MTEILETILRFAVPIIGVVGTLAVSLIGLVIGRLYKSVDLLFAQDKAMEKRIKVLELAALKNDPDSTGLFRALSGNGDRHA